MDAPELSDKADESPRSISPLNPQGARQGIRVLVAYAAPGVAASYAYDALGRRIAKTVNGVTTSWVHDTGDLADLTTHDRLLEYLDGALITRWLHGQQIDEPVAFERYAGVDTPGAGAAYQLHADRQGSVIAVTDAVGQVVSRYRYDAFGQRELVAGAEVMDVGFTGREWDAETGLYHYRARVYDPGEGRFLQSDPLGFAAGDLNLYAYTWNDPANWTDPSGMLANGGQVTTSAAVAIAITSGANHLIFRAATICLASSTGSLLGSIAANYAEGRNLVGQMQISMVAPCVMQVTPGTFPMPMSDAGPTSLPPRGAPDPCKAERRQLRKHLEKFEQWQKNPYPLDNKGFGNPVLDAFHRVNRSVELGRQVMTWTYRVQKCEQEHGLR